MSTEGCKLLSPLLCLPLLSWLAIAKGRCGLRALAVAICSANSSGPCGASPKRLLVSGRASSASIKMASAFIQRDGRFSVLGLGGTSQGPQRRVAVLSFFEPWQGLHPRRVGELHLSISWTPRTVYDVSVCVCFTSPRSHHCRQHDVSRLDICTKWSVAPCRSDEANDVGTLVLCWKLRALGSGRERAEEALDPAR